MVHHYQESDVSCGVAAFQTALEHAGLQAPNTQDLADELEVDLEGTHPEAFEKALHRRSIPYVAWHGDVSLRDVRVLLEDHAIMVCYQSPELRVGHFAVINEVRQDEIELSDPWFGPCKCIDIKEFEALWESRPHSSRPLQRWMLAIRRT